MKRIFILSGIVLFLMTLLVVTGKIRLDQSILKNMNLGNAHYEDKDYNRSREIYESLLKERANNPDILHNLGLVAYAMEDYEKAIEYYTQSKDGSMLLGNAYYRQGSGTSDPTQQMKIYRQGLDQYLTGIKAQPNDIEIKYNYEFLKKLIDESDQNQEDQNEEQKNKNKQDNDQKDQEGQNEEEDNKNQQNQDGQNEEQDNQEQGNENGQNDDSNNQNNEEQENDQQKVKYEKEDGQSKNSQSEASNNKEQIEQDQKAIEQVLKMLEQQEKQSLKNNQGVMDKGEEEANDW